MLIGETVTSSPMRWPHSWIGSAGVVQMMVVAYVLGSYFDALRWSKRGPACRLSGIE